MSRYAVLGTGAAGAAVARRLAATGHEVAVWNRTPARAEALRDEVSAVADSVTACAVGADVVVLAVLDEEAVAVVLDAFGRERLDDTLVLDLTTTGTTATEQAAERVAALGGRYVKAPFFGSVPEAERGALFFLVGCAPADAEDVDAALAPLGETFDAGDPARCAALKVALNPLVFVMVGVLAEALALARAQGVDPELVLAVLARGTGVRAPIYTGRGRLMLDGDYAARAAVAMALKDLEVIARAAATAGLELPVTAAAHETFRRAAAAGYAHEDMAAVAKVVA